MPLDFAEFAHHYEGSGIVEDDQRENFEILASIMECLVRLYWQDDHLPNSLGIKLDGDTLSLFEEVESDSTLHLTFNSAALDSVAGKTDHDPQDQA